MNDAAPPGRTFSICAFMYECITGSAPQASDAIKKYQKWISGRSGSEPAGHTPGMKTMTAPDLETPYALTQDQVRFYRENGFVKLKNVFSAETIAAYAPEITRKVHELNTLHLPMEPAHDLPEGLLQVMNIWRESVLVKEFIFSRRSRGSRRS